MVRSRGLLGWEGHVPSVLSRAHKCISSLDVSLHPTPYSLDAQTLANGDRIVRTC